MSVVDTHQECGCGHGNGDNGHTETINTQMDGVFPEDDSHFAASELSCADICDLLSKMVSVIKERSGAYASFSGALETYKQDQNWTQYNLKTGELTMIFQDLSVRVLELEKQQLAGNQKQWAGMQREIQEHEKDRFKSAVQCQQLSQQYTVQKEDMWNEEYQSKLTEYRQIINRSILVIGEVMEEIEDYIRENKDLTE